MVGNVVTVYHNIDPVDSRNLIMGFQVIFRGHYFLNR